MKLGMGCGLLVTLGLISCSGTSGSTSVNGADAASIKVAPAGVSTLVFMDLEMVRPDQLTGASNLPAGVTAGASPAAGIAPLALPANPTLTFTNCRAANGGFINGTITVVQAPAGTYTETFNLTVTPTAAPVAGTPAWTWVYAGTQVVTVSGTSATLAITAGALTATFTDNSVTPAAVKTYEISTPTHLALDWTSLSAISLSGSYQVARLATGQSVTVTLLPALVWDATGTCPYPKSGTLTLDLVSPGITDHTTVTFSAACGAVTIGGVGLSLGQ